MDVPRQLAQAPPGDLAQLPQPYGQLLVVRRGDLRASLELAVVPSLRPLDRYAWVADKVHRRKMAREAARSVLPP